MYTNVGRLSTLGRRSQPADLGADFIMSKSNNLKPGTPAPGSGQYREIGPRGGERREVTSEKGNPLPPTTTKNATYNFVDPTKNKSGR